jgi:phenylacetate-CoA ligase
MLASVDGRIMDVVHCPGGQRVGGTYWTLLLRSRPGLVKFQIVQKEQDRVEILYEKEAGSEPDFSFYREEIAKTCGPEMNVDFVETSQFKHEPGTKFRLVIRES